MTQILLIRHAHNDWADHRLAGWTPGVHLNERGHAEAQALADRLAEKRLDAIYASPLERTMETARYLAEPRGQAVRALAELGEVHFGTWTGRGLAELRGEPLWATIQRFPSLAAFPEGERLAATQARAVAALDGLHARHPDEVIAVVSHGDIIKLAVAHYIGLHLDQFQRLTVGTASLTALELGPAGPRLLVFNDTGQVPPPPKAPEPETAEPVAASQE